MFTSFILLGCSLAVVGCQGIAPPAEAPLLAATAPIYVDSVSPVFAAPTLEPSPTVGGVPGFPDPLAMAPPPAFAAPPDDVTGAIASQFGLPTAEVMSAGLPNPLKVPVSNHEFAWDQIVDVVSDYFPIAREERVHIDQQIWTEGRVETPYQVAATMFEPHRNDSVGAFNRWQSTLQTVRRRAIVRVVPEPDGYLLDLRVDRELEDLPRPENATAGAASLRNDNSLPSTGRGTISRTQWSPVWIPLGRDTPLEQEMLAAIRDRLATTPHVPMTIAPVR
jgi:hypothetical protein